MTCHRHGFTREENLRARRIPRSTPRHGLVVMSPAEQQEALLVGKRHVVGEVVVEHVLNADPQQAGMGIG